MAHSELAALQIAVTAHLETVARLKKRAADKLREYKAAERAWALAERNARQIDRKSRHMLAQLLKAQMDARTARLETSLIGVKPAEIPRIARRKREIEPGQPAAKRDQLDGADVGSNGGLQ
jgi:hypothetical protein